MGNVDTRHEQRDSLFLLADLRVAGEVATHRVKVRNLSTGGMMAEVDGLAVERGTRLAVDLRNVGLVEGSVAWVQGNRFGIAFDHEIDPVAPRQQSTPAQSDAHAPRYVRPASILPPGAEVDPRNLRKI